jgi:hypothetical protein
MPSLIGLDTDFPDEGFETVLIEGEDGPVPMALREQARVEFLASRPRLRQDWARPLAST